MSLQRQPKSSNTWTKLPKDERAEGEPVTFGGEAVTFWGEPVVWGGNQWQRIPKKSAIFQKEAKEEAEWQRGSKSSNSWAKV